MKQDLKYYRDIPNSERYESFSKAFTLLSEENNSPSLDEIRESLAINHGPMIFFSENSPFILNIQSGLNRLLHHNEPDSKHVHYYCSVPCNFYNTNNRPNSKRGVLLVRSEISDSFINDINKIPSGSIIFVYFWHYALRYKIISIPDYLKQYIPDSIERIFSWLCSVHPEIMKLVKIHCYDRDRKKIYMLDSGITKENEYIGRLSVVDSEEMNTNREIRRMKPEIQRKDGEKHE